uniref:hypothetical protein n=1 Tax=Fodinicola feengrottensis TaxID=435914 RepID=UPI0036F3194E
MKDKDLGVHRQIAEGDRISVGGNEKVGRMDAVGVEHGAYGRKRHRQSVGHPAGGFVRPQHVHQQFARGGPVSAGQQELEQFLGFLPPPYRKRTLRPSR